MSSILARQLAVLSLIALTGMAHAQCSGDAAVETLTQMPAGVALLPVAYVIKTPFEGQALGDPTALTVQCGQLTVVMPMSTMRGTLYVLKPAEGDGLTGVEVIGLGLPPPFGILGPVLPPGAPITVRKFGSGVLLTSLELPIAFMPNKIGNGLLPELLRVPAEIVPPVLRLAPPL